jgi:DNA replication ATP-dependent helicase Dna2
MRSLGKNTIANTFKFDCDRFLRFKLATAAEQKKLGVREGFGNRPGMDLIKEAGRRWETEKYQDLLDVAGRSNIEHRLENEPDVLLGRRKFDKVENMFDLLRRSQPPLAIIEGEFEVPTTITPALEAAYKKYELQTVRARPDILWLRPYQAGAPLIIGGDSEPEYVIHVIDVKMAAEPTLKHFTEVTFYALALAEKLKQEGLSGRYAVSAQGLIWPGSHDAHQFRNLHRDKLAQGATDPVAEALMETLKPVPYEIYLLQVKNFFESRLLRVLEQAAEDAAWHVAPKCHICEYLPFCRKEAEDKDHLSRLAWLQQGQANLLRQAGISTTHQLAQEIEQGGPAWQQATAASQQLRAEKAALLARAKALRSQQPEPIAGRASALMPAWSDLNIYLSLHFDMGSGLTFAMGAMRVHFLPGRSPGDRPQTEIKTFIVDRATNWQTDSERARLAEFIDTVSGWLTQLSDDNAALPASQRQRAHLFFWDKLELKQFKRMLERHMDAPEIVDRVELLLRLFPPDNLLPDPDLFKSQPGTIVKEVVRSLVGLPLAHDYTLLEAASVFHPRLKADGNPYKFSVPFGFETPLTDLIPFERAYELWQDRVFLKHYNPQFPNDQSKWRRYSRDEIRDGLQQALKARLEGLEQVVSALRRHYRDRLLLRKESFSAAPPAQSRIPAKARNLIAFTRLNAAVDELKNRQDRALPVEEKEARFISIRGILPASEAFSRQAIAALGISEPRYSQRELLVLTFSLDSRDCRIGEGAFLLALSNEEPPRDLDLRWYHHLNLSFAEASQLLADQGLEDQKWLSVAPLSKLLRVELVKLEASEETPWLILSPDSPGAFRLAQSQGLIDLARPMMLDPLYADFNSKMIDETLRLIGGDPPPQKKRKKS